MPRPQRCRRICERPAFTGFSPDTAADTPPVTLTLDEFEVIRLVDLEKQTHEQCAKQMEISRSTVTEIYESARQKLADSIVNGRRLVIDGGSYRLCDGSPSWCYKKNCKKQHPEAIYLIIEKGENSMRIAVTYDNGKIFQHFGHTAQFKFYDVEDGKVVSAQIVDTNGSGHGALSGFLAANRTDVLICGGIGGGAQMALADVNIKLFGGVSGSADDAVNAYIAGTLSFNPNVRCSHHDHEHSGAAHACGDHGCGKHDCGSHSCH